MRALLTSIVIALLTLVAAPARGDGLIYQLPKDGTWALFEVSVTVKMGDMEEKASGTLRVASVGSVTEEAQPCRWIEVAFDGKREQGGQKFNLVAKALVPEKYLKKGASPVDHVLRGWLCQDKAKPKKVQDPKDVDGSPLSLIFAGPLKDAKQLDEAVVESKLGKLPCAGVAGQLELKSPPNAKAVSPKVEARLNAKAPFGLVTGRWTLDAPEDKTNLSVELKLVDFGDKAQSELPDQQ